MGCGMAFFEAIARMLPLHSRWLGSRLATKRAKARIAESRWLRVCTEQPRFVFEVVEELPYAPGREVLNRDPIDGLADPGANEGEEEGEGIAVALLRVAGEVALGDDVLGEEAAQPGAERAGLTHGLLLR